jgi:hypothetical protein
MNDEIGGAIAGEEATTPWHLSSDGENALVFRYANGELPCPRQL